MPSKTYQLVNEGSQISISWRGIWRDVEVRAGERTLGMIDGLAALQRGAEFELPNGEGTLSVQLSRGMGAHLEVLHNGAPVPGSEGHPETQIKSAVGLLFFVAGLSSVAGAAAMAGVAFLVQMGFGWGSVVFGVLMGALGAIVKLKRSKVALCLAIALFALDGALGAWISVSVDGGLPLAQLILRAVLIVIMFGGVRAIGKLENTPTT